MRSDLHSASQGVEMSKRVKFEFDETSRVSLDRLREQGAMMPPEIKLEPGWLARQMAEVREECKDWPKCLDPLRV